MFVTMRKNTDKTKQKPRLVVVPRELSWTIAVELCWSVCMYALNELCVQNDKLVRRHRTIKIETLIYSIKCIFKRKEFIFQWKDGICELNFVSLNCKIFECKALFSRLISGTEWMNDFRIAKPPKKKNHSNLFSLNFETIDFHKIHSMFVESCIFFLVNEEKKWEFSFFSSSFSNSSHRFS